MRLVFSVRLTSQMLGDHDPQNKGILAFHREYKSEDILLDQPTWLWLWQQALTEVAPQDVYTNAVRMDRYLHNMQTNLYSRRFNKGVGGPSQKRDHESIRAGAIVTFGGSVVPPDPREPQSAQYKRNPTDQELYAALVRIGETLGISPFGSKFGYGRFNIVSMEIDGRSCTPPVGREHLDGDTSVSGAPASPPDGSVGTGAGPEDVPA